MEFIDLISQQLLIRNNIDKRRDFAVDEGASDGALKILDRLSHDYEKTYGLWF